MTKKYFEILADYNQWTNNKIYEVVADLSPQESTQDRGAFFGSVLGTLNHLVVADRVWLKRFVAHPACESVLEPVRALSMPTALNQILFGELSELSEHRRWLDDSIRRWVAALEDEDLDYVLTYKKKGIQSRRRFGNLMLHFFNHQTHHRGQVTTLLFQMGRDPGVTDLMMQIPEEG